MEANIFQVQRIELTIIRALIGSCHFAAVAITDENFSSTYEVPEELLALVRFGHGSPQSFTRPLRGVHTLRVR